MKTLSAGIPKSSMIVFLVGLAGIFAGFIGTSISPNQEWVVFFDNLHWTSGTVSAAVLSWLGFKHATTKENRKTNWWFMLAFVGYAIGQIIWDIQILVRYSKFPSPSDLFYLWLGPFLTLGLLSEIAHHKPEG